MNNLKKIGLTALAGSLVATSVAYSGELAVSGSAGMNFKNFSNQSTGKVVRMANSVYLTGGGETEGGLNISVSFEMDQGTPSGVGPFDSHFVSVGNDTLGTLTVHGHGGSNSAAALDTTAAGDLWDNTLMTTAGTATARKAPLSSTSGNNLIVYSLPTLVDGLAIGASYQAANTTGSGSTAFGGTYTGIEGLSVSYGQGSSDDVLNVKGDQTIMKASYAYGPVSVGISNNEFDHTTASNDQDVDSISLSYSVSDQISVSYGEETIDRSGSAQDIEVSGISASYTSGGMTTSFAHNKADNVDHTAGKNNEMWNIGLSFAF